MARYLQHGLTQTGAWPAAFDSHIWLCGEFHLRWEGLFPADFQMISSSYLSSLLLNFKQLMFGQVRTVKNVGFVTSGQDMMSSTNEISNGPPLWPKVIDLSSQAQAFTATLA